jgi:hypothetical protein
MRRNYNVSKRIKPGVMYSYYMFTWVRLVGAIAAAANAEAFVSYTLKLVDAASVKSEVRLSDDQIMGGNFRVFGVKCGRADIRGLSGAYTPQDRLNSYLKLTYIRPVMRLKRRRFYAAVKLDARDA